METGSMSNWVEVYTRCMDGEYFRGRTCPRDGYWSDTSTEVSRIVAELRDDGAVPSLELLIERGFHGTLSDLIVVQFATKERAPGWLILVDDSPEVSNLLGRPRLIAKGE
jgi:hypothetical protein